MTITYRFLDALLAMLAIASCLVGSSIAVALQNDPLLKVFSDSTTAPLDDFDFTSTTELDLSGSNWGFRVDENDVYLVALKHTQTDGPANNDWEVRLGRGGQIYSIRSEVGEIVPPQSFGRPFIDEVFQSISVDTSTRDTGGQAVFYHQSGYYVDGSNVVQPTFSPLLASGPGESFADSNSWSTLSLGVQADSESMPQQPSGLLNYQRTRDLGGGVIEVTHSIYNFGVNRVNFHNLPWGGVRKTIFDHMLVSNPNGGFTDRPIDDFDAFANQVVSAGNTGGWAAFTEGTAETDRGVAYVFGDTDIHLSESWQSSESSWRWGDGGGDFLGFPIRNFNVGTFRRVVDVDPGDLFESRYFLVLGDVDQIETAITDRNLVSSATYNKIIVQPQDSGLLAWQILDENGSSAISKSDTGQPSDFMTYALPVNGSKPLFLYEDLEGNEFVSVDPYALSQTPYDGTTSYQSLLGFVLTSDTVSADESHVELQTVFAGNENYLNANLETAYFVLPGASAILGDVNRDGNVNFIDISPFIALLSTGGFLEEADINQDDVVDFLDISPFVRILSGG